MPVRSRETNDRPTESRIRQVIRKLLKHEVRKLISSTDSVSTQVTTNTGNIASNTSVNTTQSTDIDNLERRAAARNNTGVVSTNQLGFDDYDNIRRFSI